MLNLITNSLRFTEKGGISISAKNQNKSFIEVCVKDTGLGIAAEDLEKVFDEFRQVGKEKWQRAEGSHRRQS